MRYTNFKYIHCSSWRSNNKGIYLDITWNVFFAAMGECIGFQGKGCAKCALKLSSQLAVILELTDIFSSPGYVMAPGTVSLVQAKPSINPT